MFTRSCLVPSSTALPCPAYLTTVTNRGRCFSTLSPMCHPVWDRSLSFERLSKFLRRSLQLHLSEAELSYWCLSLGYFVSRDVPWNCCTDIVVLCLYQILYFKQKIKRETKKNVIGKLKMYFSVFQIPADNILH